MTIPRQARKLNHRLADGQSTSEAALVAHGMDPARVEEGFQDDRSLWLSDKEVLALGIVQKIDRHDPTDEPPSNATKLSPTGCCSA